MGIKLEKIQEEIKFKLSEIVKKMKDPRIPEIISFTRVKISGDLSIAKVYVSVLEYEKLDDSFKKEKKLNLEASKDNKQNAILALNRATGHIRTKIANCISLRKTPVFKFFLDDSTEYAFKIERLLSEV